MHTGEAVRRTFGDRSGWVESLRGPPGWHSRWASKRLDPPCIPPFVRKTLYEAHRGAISGSRLSMALSIHFQGGPKAGESLQFADHVERIVIGPDPDKCQLALAPPETKLPRQHFAFPP